MAWRGAPTSGNVEARERLPGASSEPGRRRRDATAAH
eukprot:CAMPEP_0185362188 /NCGR_PEP_ID=MMETSP1364-20130426/10852_1 /TAXON_ID=38817 /ORGANISM="Gephyrocapsa oceanica, Strain RCC1303" /LENGTH=36 /DNA_ID= /DNA_START= /DNA_END= /DNA_ORIENTATION=